MPAKKRVVKRKRKAGGPIWDATKAAGKNVAISALQAGLKEAKKHVDAFQKHLEAAKSGKKPPSKQAVTAGALRKRRALVKRLKPQKKGGALPKKRKRKKKGLSTGARIGIGLGAAAAVGAAGYGAYKVGKGYKRQTKVLGAWDSKKKRWSGK